MPNNIPNSTLLVVIGISGDLSHRYLLPALVEVKKAGQLPPHFKLLGISRRELKVSDVLSTSKLQKSGLDKYLSVHQMNLDKPGDYKLLAKKISEFGCSQIIFYFAIPPDATPGIVSNLGQAGLNKSNTKLLLEKPFGIDLESAKQAISDVAKYYKEKQVYRIDHYLAKEMAQNITVFLGGNILFRDVWSNRFIESIKVVVAEKIGIEGRAKFYEQSGALRDIIQSHALQLVALTIMEPCSSVFEFEELPKRRLRALRSLSIVGEPIRAQYEGYKNEVGNSSSNIETFVAMHVKSSMPKWRGVPISVITGKSLDAKSTEISVSFSKTHEAQANTLVLRIQPHEGLELDLWVKEPGYERKLKKLKLGFDYDQHFNHLPDAYEQVLVDAMKSNQHLFASSQEVLAAWEILQTLQKEWSESPIGLKVYKKGSKAEDILKS